MTEQFMENISNEEHERLLLLCGHGIGPSLSPAAQAVWEAFNQDEPGVFVDYGDCLAAALRAAADQVVPEQAEPPCGENEPWPQSYQLMADSKWEQRQQTRAELLAIAAELEAQ
jgi:hypothetical protein